MTGLVQCLLPPSALAALSPNNAPFHHLALEAAILLSNTLPALLLAGALYGGCWRPQQVGSKLWRPGVVMAAAALAGVLFKYAVGIRHSGAPAPECCMGYVLVLDYSLPSVHAALAVLLALYAGAPYWRLAGPVLKLQQQQHQAMDDEDEEEHGSIDGDATAIEVDVEAASIVAPTCAPLSTTTALLTTASLTTPTVDAAELFDARIRFAALWCYALAICVARIVLRLNSIWDVLLGAALGGAAYSAARAASRWLEAPGGSAGVKND